VWSDLHHQLARERHASLMHEAECERLAAAARPERRSWRFRLGRLQLSWNCAVAARERA
jgi:hypothetical protein